MRTVQTTATCLKAGCWNPQRNQVFDLVAVVGSRERSELCAVVGSRRSAGTIAPAMADEREPSLQEQLEGIGAQLDWVRGYL